MKTKNTHRKNATTSPLPEIAWSHRSRAVDYDQHRVESVVATALPLCLREAVRLPGPLTSLTQIEISVVGRRRMAAIHREFLGIFGATDVITFPYGEILICADVAAERSEEFELSTTDELALYAIHGLLHLAGLDDLTPRDARRMNQTQSRILKAATAPTR